MHLQGPVPLDDPDYAVRAFELRLVREVQAGNWVLLLGPRQHGKTSAYLRLRKTLNDHATQTVMVDLQRCPPLGNYSQLVTWFARQVAVGLNNSTEVKVTDDLAEALAQALPAGTNPIVVLIDEASGIENVQWRNGFYGQLRAISSERGAANAGEIAKRLRFVFAGTFIPERLVQVLNSPFNICERIETSDLSIAEIQQLSRGVGLVEPEIVGSAIHEQVGGQPYLVQCLLQAAIGQENPIDAVREESENLVESDHVSHLFRRVVSDEGLTTVISNVVRDGQVTAEAGNDDQRLLVVLGLLQRDRGILRFRNSLYANIAARSPQFARVVPVEAGRALIFPVDSDSFKKVASVELREIAITAQHGGVGAYQAGSCRIALAGFGTALEAVLLDFLKQRDAAEIATAAGRCRFGRFEVATDPASWTLANLMKGVRGLLHAADLDIPENLREWRNFIHPSVSLRNYKPDGDLAPEVCAAAAQLGIVLRDLP